jgi:VWFA-related protein
LSFNQIDPVNFPLIFSYLNIQDDNGNSIADLDSSHFSLEEDGVKEDIAVTKIDSSGGGIHVALVLDRSSSLTSNDIIDLKNAAIYFVNQMNDSDQVAIVSFGENVKENQSFTNDKKALTLAISNYYDSSDNRGTALYDGICTAAKLTNTVKIPRALVVITDGMDNSSTLDSLNTISYLIDNNIPCYTIGLGTTLDEDLLTALSDSTHAAYYHAPKSSELLTIYEAISKTIRIQYQITYTSHNPLRDGTWRIVQITVNHNSLSDTGSVKYLAPIDPDFQLFVSPDTFYIDPGERVSYLVSMDTLNGFTGKVGLSVSGYPNDITHLFRPDSIDVSSTSLLEIQTNSSTLPGTYNLSISGTDGLLSRSTNATLVVNITDSVKIYPATDSLTYYADDKFWLNIWIGDSTNKINNLYGVSFALLFDSEKLSIESPVENNVVAGPLLGSTSEIKVLPVIVLGDTLFAAVTRIDSNRKGVYGSGIVLRVKFKIRKDTPDTTICFKVIELEARDPNWNSLNLISDDACIAIKGWFTVWPGDTDDNGFVDQADMLPIGLSWSANGYKRIGYSNSICWQGQKCHPWISDERYTYADANGNGEVEESDILVIGCNWHYKQDQSDSICTDCIYRSLNGNNTGKFQTVIMRRLQNHIFDIALYVKDVENLLGMSIRLLYPAEMVDVISVNQDNFFGNSPLFMYRNNTTAGVLGIGVCRIRPEGSISGSGCVAKVRLRAVREDDLSKIIIEQVAGIDESGNQLDFHLSNELTHGIKRIKEFVLYQNYPNPFNVRTTIRYELPLQSFIVLNVYDLLGANVVTLVNQEKEMGCHEEVWDGCNQLREPVSSGIYYISINADNFKCVRKCLVLK